MALRNVAEAESLLALVLKPASLDGLYQDIDALAASTVEAEPPESAEVQDDDEI